MGSIAIDPRNSSNLMAFSLGQFAFPVGGLPAQLYRSTDEGASWKAVPLNLSPPLTIDATTNPSTIYAGLSARSTDGGNTWTPLTPPFTNPSAVFADPRSGALYASAGCKGTMVSLDRGHTWEPTGSPVPVPPVCINPPVVGSFVAGAVPNSMYAVVPNNQSSAFVSKLSPDGGTLVYSTFLNGHASMAGTWHKADEPEVFQRQNWASAIAVDAAGNIIVGGGTHSSDFPSKNAVRTPGAGGADAFVVTISPDGAHNLSTEFLGGTQNDAVLAVTIDADGDSIAGGISSSSAFANGFVAKFATGPAQHRKNSQRR